MTAVRKLLLVSGGRRTPVGTLLFVSFVWVAPGKGAQPAQVSMVVGFRVQGLGKYGIGYWKEPKGGQEYACLFRSGVRIGWKS